MTAGACGGAHRSASLAQPGTRVRSPLLQPRRTAALRLLIAAIVVGSVLVPQRVAAATDRLPDLRMWNLSDFRTETVNGERRLRFTTNMTNEGAGPLEVRGSRSAVGEPHLRTMQVIYNDAGGHRFVDSRALMEWASDGHNHWHIQGVMLYQMWSGDGQARRGTKVGFCFLDSARMFGTTPFRYSGATCGGPNNLTNQMGLSTGWGDVYPWNFAFQWIEISALPPGDYFVQAVADEQNWYVESNESNNCAWARVRIAATNGPVHVYEQGRSCIAQPASTARVERQYGSTRQETAAAVAEDAFAPGVPIAFVATGSNFPDALAAGVAAGVQGGPVILVEHGRLPALAVTELERLNPSRIVVAGGPGAVSSYLDGLIAPFNTGGGFGRLYGPDRYATAASISAATFSPGVAVAYVTTGANWPDALATVPHAIRARAPLLLTRGGSLPDPLKNELARLQPGRIIVVGGSGVVSDAVLAELDAYDTGGGVQRIGGANRYETAAMLSAAHHPGGAPLVYVATGLNFPDALAAGPAAGLRGAPTILVGRTSIPPASAAELDRLNPNRIIMLGGPAILNLAVQNALRGYTPG
jgi:putative cell wall-binding protein